MNGIFLHGNVAKDHLNKENCIVSEKSNTIVAIIMSEK